MNNPWLVFILMGLAAAFLPLQFGTEIYLFGVDDGRKKAASLVGGITLFRMFILIIGAIIFLRPSGVVAQGLAGFFGFVQQTVTRLGGDATSGNKVFLDLLLLVCGVLLLIAAFRHWRFVVNKDPGSGKRDKVDGQLGVRSLLFLGFGWAAVSINQWLFTAAGVNAIGEITLEPFGILLLMLLFLALASLLILLPFLLQLIQPDKAEAILARVKALISGWLGYIFVLLLAAAGLYLIWIAAQGLLNAVS